MRGHLTLLLPLAILAFPMASATPEGSLSVVVDQLGEVTGGFEGVCSAAGLRFPPNPANTLAIAYAQATMVVHRVWTNDTYARPPGGSRWEPLDAHQVDTTSVLPPGTLEIQWNESGGAFIARELGGPAFDVPFATEKATIQASGPGNVLSTNYPVTLRNQLGREAVVFLPAQFPGGSFWVDGLRPASASGTFIVSMDDASVSVNGGDYVLDLPPYRQSAATDLLAASVERQVYTYADLHVTDGHVDLARAPADVFCQEIKGHVLGGVALHSASGHYVDGARNLTFASRELAFAGEFDVDQRAMPEGNSYRSALEAKGTFSAVSLDFRIVPTVPTAWEPERIALAAALAGLLAVMTTNLSRIVGLFYTRFEPSTALKHPTRATLVSLAGEKPGLILRDVVEITGRPYGVIRHHARILETVGLIKTLRIGPALHVYLADRSLVEGRRNLMMEQDEPVKFIVERFRAGVTAPSELRKEVAVQFLLTRMGAWKAVKRAQDHGLLGPGKPS